MSGPLYPTMSRSGLLLQCGYPFSVPGGFTRDLPPEERSPSRDEAADYGLDFHAAMNGQKSRARDGARRKTKLGKGVLEHAKEGAAVLGRWLKHEGRDAKGSLREVSYAYDVRAGTARLCKPPDEKTHVYPDQKPGELCGTADLVLLRKIPPKGEPLLPVAVIDYKTGADDSGAYARPSRLPQLQSLALAAATGNSAYPLQAQLAVLHAPRDATAVLYADPMTPGGELEKHRLALVEAFSRIGDGSMRPGPECGYCPARDICPTRGADLLTRADTLFGKLAVRQSAELLISNDTHERSLSDEAADALAEGLGSGVEAWDAKLGRLYELTKLAEDTAREVRRRLAAERRKGHLPVLSDGRVLDFRSKKYRNLSMSGMVRQIGKLAAEREINRLEKLGAIEEVEREELRPVDD